MQVTNVADQITHAVVGKGKALELQIADTPEFFRILSSSLYSDKMLAVVREILCNAWDAHIEAGLTDMAIEVTLTEQKLIIRDFGEGISEPKIVDIYGTYGGSTKRDNVLVTGGFGLGSKAPFAYTDHFEVTSFNMGEKTIYRMSLSSAVVGGKPSIIPVVAVPTDESGLQVSLNLKSPSDKYRFQELITRIVQLGGMKVKLNGNLLETLPFMQAKDGFMLIRSDMIDYKTDSRIRIRYGHVVYPTSTAPEFHHIYQKVVDFLDEISIKNEGYYNNKTWTLVLQAEPGSVTVTPSRESLEMTEHTAETIRTLLTEFMNNSAIKFHQMCLERTKQVVDRTVAQKKYKELFSKKLPLAAISKIKDGRVILSMDALAEVYLQLQYPDSGEYKRKDLILRSTALANSGIGKRGMFQAFTRELERQKNLSKKDSNWVHRRYFRWIIKGMAEAKLDPKKLLAYTEIQRRYRGSSEYAFVPAISVPPRGLVKQFPFLRGIVMLAYNRPDIDRACNFPIMKDQLGTIKDTLFYQVPRTGPKAAEARAYFQKLGVTLIDLTVRQPWEPEVVLQPIPKPVSTAPKRKKGYPKLSAAIPQGAKWASAHTLWSEDSPRTEKAKFFVRVPMMQSDIHSFGDLGMQGTAAMIRLWGDQGIGYMTANQLDKIEKAGMVRMDEFLKDQIHHEFQTNTKLKAAYQQEVDAGVFGYGRSSLKTVLRTIQGDENLRKKFQLPPRPKQRERDIMELWDTYGDYDIRHCPKLKDCDKLIKEWKTHPKITEFIQLLKNNKLIGMFEEADFAAVFADTDSRQWTDDHRKTARKLLLLALKG